MSSNAHHTSSNKQKRRQALTILGASLAAVGIAYGTYWYFVLDHYESTDNAYVQGHVVQLMPQVGGTVLAINADDTDHVKAGQVLVKLDTADARVALDQAEAQLAQTVREVRTLYANNSALQAQVALREADLARAKTDLAKAVEDVDRRAPLIKTGAVGKEEFEHAQTQLAAVKSAVAAAQAAVVAAQEQLRSNLALTEGVSVEQHPSVQRAAARVKESYLALSRDELLAPIEGNVARRSVQLGQRVAPGTPLMSVIALDQVWVEANFKESQLKNVRIGQPVELVADVYGGKVKYHGRVEGLAAGTGAAFALLPAQNASGNWIKVVQRVPVRVALEGKELQEHPLRVGLSMEATVDVSQRDGAVLAAAENAPKSSQTTVFAEESKKADDEVRRIILANGGRVSRATAQEALTRGPGEGKERVAALSLAH